VKSLVERLLRGKRPAPEQPQAFLPAGRRVYCIGDIHGRLDLLQQLQAQIVADAAGFPGEKTLVYLGDYIDRGDESKEVIDLMLQQPLHGFETVHLLGNHEQTLLDFLQHPHDVTSWLHYGGRETLLSYGVPVGFATGAQDIDRMHAELEQRLPAQHLEFYQQLKLFHISGKYGFVHAGIRPGIPLGAQAKDDLLWIRDEFTGSKQMHELVIVHGHTITAEVEFHDNRIGIDTGAFHSGVLTCLVLEGTEQRLLQTGPGAGRK
jgi:serine/threonine protein phosphatase 1